MTLLQKILFTVVFTIYGAVLYGISYYLLALWDPALVADPARLGNEHLLFVTAAFTVIVALAYVGAGCVVLGHLPGQSPFDSSDGWTPRRRSARSGSSAKRPARQQSRPLQPEVPAGLRASRKDFGQRDQNRAGSRDKKPGTQRGGNSAGSRGDAGARPRGDSAGS